MEEREGEEEEAKMTNLWTKSGCVYREQAAVYKESVHIDNVMMSVYNKCEEFRSPFDK